LVGAQHIEQRKVSTPHAAITSHAALHKSGFERGGQQNVARQLREQQGRPKKKTISMPSNPQVWIIPGLLLTNNRLYPLSDFLNSVSSSFVPFAQMNSSTAKLFKMTLLGICLALGSCGGGGQSDNGGTGVNGSGGGSGEQEPTFDSAQFDEDRFE
jgi:hypothetical protein